MTWFQKLLEIWDKKQREYEKIKEQERLQEEENMPSIGMNRKQNADIHSLYLPEPECTQAPTYAER